jgi:hypothetical protein
MDNYTAQTAARGGAGGLVIAWSRESSCGHGAGKNRDRGTKFRFDFRQLRRRGGACRKKCLPSGGATAKPAGPNHGASRGEVDWMDT